MTYKLQKTSDYSKFKFFKFNRKVSSLHVYKLADSIKRENRLEINPIVVSDDFYIFDGQHRFAACKLLGIPVPYVITDSKIENVIIDANAISKIWVTNDYLYFYSYRNYQEYDKLIECMKEYKITCGMALKLHAVLSSANVEGFKAGNFKFSDEVNNFLYTINSTIIFLREYLDDDRKKILRNYNLLVALFDFYRSNEAKLRRLLTLIKDEVFEIPDFGSYKEYIKLFNKLYTRKVLKKKTEQ